LRIIKKEDEEARLKEIIKKAIREVLKEGEQEKCKM